MTGVQTCALPISEAPSSVSRSLWLQDPTGPEKRVGFLEVDIMRSGAHDAVVTTRMTIQSEEFPPFAAGTLSQLVGPLADIEGELNVYLGRYKGVTRIDGWGELKGKDGATLAGDGDIPRRAEFVATRFRGDKLKVITRFGPDRSSRTVVDYDPRMPFGGGVSPFSGGGRLRLGSSWTVTHFNPFTRSSSSMLIRVEEEGEAKYKNETVPCWVLRAHPVASPGSGAGPGTAPGRGADQAGGGSFGLSTSTAWVARKPGSEIDGQVLREETGIFFFKLATVLEDLRFGNGGEGGDQAPSPSPAPVSDRKPAGGNAAPSAAGGEGAPR